MFARTKLQPKILQPDSDKRVCLRRRFCDTCGTHARKEFQTYNEAGAGRPRLKTTFLAFFIRTKIALFFGVDLKKIGLY